MVKPRKFSSHRPLGRSQGYSDPIGAYCTGRDGHALLLQHMADAERVLFFAPLMAEGEPIQQFDGLGVFSGP